MTITIPAIPKPSDTFFKLLADESLELVSPAYRTTPAFLCEVAAAITAQMTQSGHKTNPARKPVNRNSINDTTNIMIPPAIEAYNKPSGPNRKAKKNAATTLLGELAMIIVLVAGASVTSCLHGFYMGSAYFFKVAKL
jgi:hypothetical protein